MCSGDFSLTTEPNFDHMKVLELKQYLQVRGISITAKRREELLTFLFAIPIQYMCFCLMISSHSGCCTLNYIVLGCTLFSPNTKQKLLLYLLDKVGQKEQGLLPSKNCGLTVSHFRAITRKSFYIFVRYTYSRTARKPNTFLSSTTVS